MAAKLSIIASLLPAGVTASQAGELITLEQHSEALGRPASFDVFVPEGAAPEEGWPVLYLLHGAYGNFKDWTTGTGVEAIAQEEGVMLVLPDGGEFGWYLDSPVSPESRYETRVIEEILPLVERLFRTRTDRVGRGICGLSMGGHGAISLAAKHPDLFASASSLSGILVMQNHIERWEIADRMGGLQNSPEFWAAHSCIELAPLFADANIRLLLDCGIDDTDTGAIFDNREFHARLEELGIKHIYNEHPGGHSWEYWGGHIGEHVRFHGEGFRR